MKAFLKNVLAVFVLALGSVAVAAEPVNVVVPFPPGGINDVFGRYVAKLLTDSGTPAVVINKPGAQGQIGIKYANESKDPNRTLLMLSAGPGLFSALMTDPRPYDIRRDFEPITLLATDPVVFYVGANHEITNINQLIKKAKSNPGKVTYAAAAAVHKFAGELFAQRADIKTTAIPVQGGPQAIVTVAGGHTDFGIANYSDAKQMFDQGKIKIIGIASAERHTYDKEIKTFKEQGINGFEISSWFAIVAPKGADISFTNKISRLVSDSLKTDKSNDFLHRVLTPVGSDPNTLKSFLEKEFKTWEPLVKPQQ